MNEVKLEPKEGTFLARIKELEARVAELEAILRCPNCLAIMEDIHGCIFCGWKAEQP